ncbi:MAG: translation initiation factor IF-2 [Candidatus Aenigmarchaeota archaeon]|nr:translation initiation factor IF-2 [Candidatus Aenigmarchaeota archaeon]
MEELRQPIVAVLGHVDHGKTSILDAIRQTAIASKEAGGITQAIGTTEIPLKTIENSCGHLLSKFNFKITVPGLLFIDTPGHEAFTTLRKRGGSIADIAILVVDINEGVMPQTKESIEILKMEKTPFVIAVNKIDRIEGWESGNCFLENFSRQSDDAKGEFEKKFYMLMEQFNKLGFSADRYDRIQDFRHTVAAVPISAKTGEGIPDLLVTLVGLAQQFLKDKLILTEKCEGMILEVKELAGHGTTIDAIIYNGIIRKNDIIAIGGKTPKIAKIRALLVPEQLRDMRTEKKFRNVDEMPAAAGIKISSPGIEDVVAGSYIRTAKSLEEAEKIVEEMEKEVETIEIYSETEGLILKADNIGSLEALESIFSKYPIREASLGTITRKDIMSAEANTDFFNRIIIGFNTKPAEETEKFASDKKIKILYSDVIYRLIEDYEKWSELQKESIKQKEIEEITRPGKITILPGCTFRASNPAIVGCEVLGGIVRPKFNLFKEVEDFPGTLKECGEIKQIQSQGENVSEAKTGDKVAISIMGPAVGRQIIEGDILYTDISSDEYKKLIKNEKLLSDSEVKALNEIRELKRKKDPKWGL